MIGYYTDNPISQAVMGAFSKGEVKTAHIRDFDPYNIDNPIFYGILRGTGAAMRHLQFLGETFWYLDNGYFDALYVDKKGIKDTRGKYRVVRSEMIEEIKISPKQTATGPMRIMFMPPSVYTAFMYDTTPEDWNNEWVNKVIECGHEFVLRPKENGVSVEESLKEVDAVFAFNSIAVMKAIEMGKAVYTTHGIIRNADLLGEYAPYYDFDKIKKFYEPKQFTLAEIADLGAGCLR